MTDAFIYDIVHTPRDRGRRDGALHSVKPVNLMARLLRAIQRRNSLDTARVDDIMPGCVTPVGGQNADIAKTAALVTDWDEQVAGMQINRFYASGLEAVDLGTMKVRSSFESLVLVDGVEPVSHVPMGFGDGAWVLDPETDLHTSFIPQRIGADLIATLEGFSRADVGAFTLHPQQKTAKTRAEGLFGKSLVPVADQNSIVLLDHDGSIHAGSTLEGLAALKPNFEMMRQMGFGATTLRKYSQAERIERVHTSGNSSGVVDSTSAVLTGSEAKGREPGLKARTQIVAIAVISTDPTIMLTGPAPATRKALAKAGLKVEGIDLFETNEAFASVIMRFMKDMGVAESKVDVDDGAIAMGCPLDTTDCIILGTLLDELERRSLRYDLATLYVGGSMGITTIIGHV